MAQATAKQAAQPSGARELELGSRLLGQQFQGEAVTSEDPADAPQEPMSEDQAPDAQAQGQPSTEGDADPEITGDESGEQLEEMGLQSKTGAAHERIRKLARERNEAKKENELLRQELLKSRVSPQGGQESGGGAKAQQPGPPPFNVPEPGPNASDEEKFRWAVKKEAHEASWESTMKFGAELINALAPALRGTLESQHEKEWDALSPSLEAAGTSRDELEPLVAEVRKQEPHRSLRSITFDIMDRMNLLGGRAAAPTPPASTKPGANGKPRVPGTAQAPKSKAPTRQESLQALRQSVESGDRMGANGLLGKLLLQAQDRR